MRSLVRRAAWVWLLGVIALSRQAQAQTQAPTMTAPTR
jgi:hypothetical protein